MSINAKFQPMLHSDSKSSLDTIGVLATPSSTSTAPPRPDSRFRTTASCKPPTPQPDIDVIKSSQGTIEQVNTILKKVNDLADSLNSTKASRHAHQ